MFLVRPPATGPQLCLEREAGVCFRLPRSPARAGLRLRERRAPNPGPPARNCPDTQAPPGATLGVPPAPSFPFLKTRRQTSCRGRKFCFILFHYFWGWLRSGEGRAAPLSGSSAQRWEKAASASQAGSARQPSGRTAGQGPPCAVPSGSRVLGLCPPSAPPAPAHPGCSRRRQRRSGPGGHAHWDFRTGTIWTPPPGPRPPGPPHRPHLDPGPDPAAPGPPRQRTVVAADPRGGAAAPAPARLVARLAGRRQVVLLLAAQRLGRAHEAAELVAAADAGPEAAPFAPGSAGEALAGGRGVSAGPARPGARARGVQGPRSREGAHVH